MDGSSSTTFYSVKFENMPKIQCTLAFVVRVYRGSCSNIFHLICPGMRMKISNSKFGAFPTKILEPKSLRFNFLVLQLYRKYLHPAKNIIDRETQSPMSPLNF